MTCKDCIHYYACKEWYYDGKDNFDIDVSAEYCKLYKNKADFVEVCHCHECRHCEVYISNGGIYSYQCVRTIEWVKANHFCSYGERKGRRNM